MRSVSNLRLPKEQKQRIQEKKLSDKRVEGIKKMNFSLNTLQLIFQEQWENLFYQYNFKKSTNINKYIRRTKIAGKHVLSTPLNSLAFNGSQYIQ